MIWPYIIVFILSVAVGYALTPKPQTAPPAGLDAIKAPTAEEGREIPVLFGTRLLQGPNVTWYGNLKVQAVRSKSGGK